MSTDPRAVRRGVILKTAAFALIALVCAGASFAWWTSYSANAELTATAQTLAREYAADADYPLTRQMVIEDRDFGKILGLLQKLRDLPTGYGIAATRSVPEGLGLGQRPRSSASRPPLTVSRWSACCARAFCSASRNCSRHRDEPGFIYEALKVYLMLGAFPTSRWTRTSSATEGATGATLFRGHASGRQALADHLDAMLDLDNGELLVHPNQTLHRREPERLSRA